mmetsp:Transcript_30062/g.73174  ORF Transcript_30062/g.73174 Transcript_30062/m.73174 type:complete len:264 (-) Transcript_30062:135-926(-)
MRVLCVCGPDRDVVEQAETEASPVVRIREMIVVASDDPVNSSMVTGRANGTKGILRTSFDDFIDSIDDAASCLKCSLQRFTRDCRVLVKQAHAPVWKSVAPALKLAYIGRRMTSKNVSIGGRLRVKYPLHIVSDLGGGQTPRAPCNALEPHSILGGVSRVVQHHEVVGDNQCLPFVPTRDRLTAVGRGSPMLLWLPLCYSTNSFHNGGRGGEPSPSGNLKGCAIVPIRFRGRPETLGGFQKRLQDLPIRRLAGEMQGRIAIAV